MSVHSVSLGCFQIKSVHFSGEEYMHSVSLNCFRMKNLCIQYHYGLFLDEECKFTITVDCFRMKSVHSVSPWIVFRWRVCAFSISGLFSDEEVQSLSLWIAFRWRVWVYVFRWRLLNLLSVWIVFRWRLCACGITVGGVWPGNSWRTRPDVQCHQTSCELWVHFLPGLQHCCREIIRLCRNACLCLCCSVLFCFW